MGNRARRRGVRTATIRHAQRRQRKTDDAATAIAQRAFVLAREVQANAGNPEIGTGGFWELALRTYAVCAAEVAAPIAGIQAALITASGKDLTEEDRAVLFNLEEYYTDLFFATTRNFDPEHFRKWQAVQQGGGEDDESDARAGDGPPGDSEPDPPGEGGPEAPPEAPRADAS